MVDHSSNSESQLWPKLAVLAAAILLGAAVYWYWRDWLSLDRLVEQEDRLLAAYRDRPLLTYAAAFALYVVVAALAVPGGSTALSLLCAWLFGFWRALVLVSFASTSGASLAFLLSRYLFRDVLRQRLGARLEPVEAALDKDGPFYLFTLRLIPAVPFFLINILMALTPLKLSTFWWVSQLGMLPGTSVYLYAGASVPSLAEIQQQGVSSLISPQLVAALMILGLLPLLMRKVVRSLEARWHSADRS
jgi:uncharacterized membrane protein YdjX (TVP38/TMEM64 family)